MATFVLVLVVEILRGTGTGQVPPSTAMATVPGYTSLPACQQAAREARSGAVSVVTGFCITGPTQSDKAK
jgi:hypothetical protein